MKNGPVESVSVTYFNYSTALINWLVKTKNISGHELDTLSQVLFLIYERPVEGSSLYLGDSLWPCCGLDTLKTR